MAITFYDEHGKRGIPENAFEQLTHESDRSVGIVGGTLVEQRLTELLKSRFPAGKETKTIIDNQFHPSGALGSFSVKIDVAYLFGHISKTVWRELVTIKHIRNKFAHYLDISSFEDDSIKGLCANLKMVESIIPRSHSIESGVKASTGRASVTWGGPSDFLKYPRDRFISSAAAFNYHLARATLHNEIVL